MALGSSWIALEAIGIGRRGTVVAVVVVPVGVADRTLTGVIERIAIVTADAPTIVIIPCLAQIAHFGTSGTRGQIVTGIASFASGGQ